MKVTQRVPVLRGELTDDLGASIDSRDRIELQRASMRRNIMLKGLGIRGMSAKGVLSTSVVKLQRVAEMIDRMRRACQPDSTE